MAKRSIIHTVTEFTEYFYSGPRLNIKTLLPRYGDSFNGKTYLYWDDPLYVLWRHDQTANFGNDNTLFYVPLSVVDTLYRLTKIYVNL